MREHDDLAKRLKLVPSVPGIGERTALALILRMPELGDISREQAAALAGLAPFVQQSGRWAGQAHIAGGRSRLRRSLHAAALPAAFRWNPALKTLYERHVKRGKAHTEPSSPAPESSSSSPTPSSPAAPPGPTGQCLMVATA
ncbi:MAG: transposase [Rhodospirillales bacterium]